MFLQRIFFGAAMTFVAFLVVGCTGSSAPAPQAMTPPERAIVVTGGNAGSTTVFIPTSDPNSPMMLSTAGNADVCPECKAAAIKYFTTGVLDPKCSRTGATRTVATYVPPPTNLGHN